LIYDIPSGQNIRPIIKLFQNIEQIKYKFETIKEVLGSIVKLENISTYEPIGDFFTKGNK
jgi:hypothetical protein